MANVNWASEFFGAVTSRLPDLLTECGEGKELVAFDKLREELGAKDKIAKEKRAKELQAELDALNGKTTEAPAAAPAVETPTALAAPAEATETATKTSRNR